MRHVNIFKTKSKEELVKLYGEFLKAEEAGYFESGTDLNKIRKVYSRDFGANAAWMLQVELTHTIADLWYNERMNLTNLSRYMSLILRHKPEVIGITLDEHGWASVDELISGIEKKNPGFSMDILEEIVKTDNKQRYSFNSDKTLIRANQGHSIDVDVELEEKEPPEYLYHGTGEKYVKSIDQDGLVPKSRLYVHLSKDVETAENVGKRHGKEVVYCVSSGQMFRDGYKFYLSENGVWLTKEVPVKYLER